MGLTRQTAIGPGISNGVELTIQLLIPGPLCVGFGRHPAVYTVNGPGISEH